MNPSPPEGCGAVVDWSSSVDESELGFHSAPRLIMGMGDSCSGRCQCSFHLTVSVHGVSPLLLSQPVFLVQSSVKKYSL